jgi:protein ImuB
MRKLSQPALQLDVFPVSPSSLAPERKPADQPVLEPVPLHAPAPESPELWLGVHLPHLEATSSAHFAPGEVHRRRRSLEQLATRAQNFTPRVSLAPPDGLLLEIKGSLRLFSGVENLCRLLTEDYRAADAQPVLAVAPTPLAALARARARHEPFVMNHARLTGSITSLPLAALRWPEDVLARLTKIGVYTAGQALRLPRTGFARRFGVAQLASLDRLTGRAATPLSRFLPRERFRRIRDLPYEIESHEGLLHALRPMLQALEEFLRSRQAGITLLECRFRHRNAAVTSCALNLSAPAADADRLALLLSERLSSVVLPQPVRVCELRTDVISPLSQVSHSLWQPGEHGGAGAIEGTRLIEHLRSRLSAQSVHGLEHVPDHRPEHASRPVEPCMRHSAHTPSGSRQPRPIWLLPVPQPLRERAGWPWYHGPLDLGPLLRKERIEAASWDWSAHGIARDYDIAVDSRRSHLWIFRERAKPHRWFLHGIFG